MRVNRFLMVLVAMLLLITIAGALQSKAQPGPGTDSLDAKVKAFLDGARHEWRVQNVP